MFTIIYNDKLQKASKWKEKSPENEQTDTLNVER